MELWHGEIYDFVRYARTGTLAPDMIKSFYTYHGHQPGESEVRSWENSLAALGNAVKPLDSRDIGVVVEYHLPFSNQRIDVVFIGKSDPGSNQSMVVELKQWSTVDIEDDDALNVLVDGYEHAHPSQQALDYAGCLEDVHSAFVEGAILARACSFCHNLAPSVAAPLLSSQFTGLLAKSPLFKMGEESLLASHLQKEVGCGDGIALLKTYTTGRFRPNKRLLEVLEKTIRSNDQWHLLGRQREAYNSVFADVRRLQKKKGRSAVLIRGGPGTGKTVIAVQLLADCLRLGLTGVHSTGGKAFTTTLRSKFKGAEHLFIWNMNTKNAPPQSIDLLLVDEAHRVRRTSDTRWTKKTDRSGKSQMQELMECSKVTVFLLDENQYVRPDEVGSTQLVKEACDTLKVRLKEYDLDTQFRCGGCTEYASWIDYILGFQPKKPDPWGQMYHIDIIDSPEDLDEMMAEAKSRGEKARLAAGFCWPWSNPESDGSLISDVSIGAWSRPWNRKEEERKRYTPSNHPYTLWAETAVGEEQVGCVYSAQGFEFDRLGVIWGEDLVWRDDGWVAQKNHSFDRPVKTVNADTLRLVKNAYRVLLTRGMKGTTLLCLDEETRSHIREELAEMQPPSIAKN